ncbi:aldo/keto reductase [Sphaerisporangium dianthi]|uniref:Aldo/keto reductase n=1 Tax=Sphaerisporangium dianthi TaxID=1436120 RepID=A0ABV9CWF4_9ACTN
MAVPAAPTVKLVNGASIPAIGLGTYPMTDSEAEVVVADAIQAGYRLFDTAYAYGNEVGVGRGLRAGGVPREELFVTTKLNGEWHGYEAAQEAFQASADRLGVDYVDLYLIHWPLPREDRFVEAWKGLVKLLRDGRVRAIGVSNFKPAHIDRIVAETGVVPDVNQIQLNPAVTREAARAYHAAQGIVTQSWSPLGGQGAGSLGEEVVTGLAERYGKTPAQIVLRWHLDLGLITVPKSATPERVRANIDVFDFALTAEEVAAISALDRGEAAAVDSDVFGH